MTAMPACEPTSTVLFVGNGFRQVRGQLRGIAVVLLALVVGLTVCFRSQLWRAVTTFIYFSPLSMDFILHLFFM